MIDETPTDDPEDGLDPPERQHHDGPTITVEDEMRRSYLDYAMSVIVSRAIPDLRDGLKPVHRRIIYGMHEGGYDWNKAYKKAGRPDLSLRIIEFLTYNAVVEKRFQDAAQYYWMLSAESLRLVKEMAHEHEFQVLYLTCSDRFDALADELVVLSGPSSERVLTHPRPAAPTETTPPAAPDRPPDTPDPVLRFAPDPRRNPDPVAPRRKADEEPMMEPLFGDPEQEAAEASEPVRVPTDNRPCNFYFCMKCPKILP